VAGSQSRPPNPGGERGDRPMSEPVAEDSQLDQEDLDNLEPATEPEEDPPEADPNVGSGPDAVGGPDLSDDDVDVDDIEEADDDGKGDS
jgi:hypothetical protein